MPTGSGATDVTRSPPVEMWRRTSGAGAVEGPMADRVTASSGPAAGVARLGEA